MAEARNEGGTAVQVERCTEILDNLKTAYNMELETVINYLTNSINLEGVRAAEIKDALAEDIKTELGHAERLAKRIHVLGGLVPGSQELVMNQQSLQARLDLGDVPSVIRGVIEAEEGACKQYQKLVELCGDFDFVTQNICIELLEDEQEHRREFAGFLKEYERR